MKSRMYREHTRRAQRWFTLSNKKIEAYGTNRGLKFSCEFPLAALSPDTEHVVAFRHDLVRRCLFLTSGSVLLGLAVARIDVPFAWLGILVFSILLAGKFLWHAIQWMRGPEEVEIFKDDSGQLAFEVFNDKSGASEYAAFVSELKAAIRSAKEEPNQSPQTTSGSCAPLRV